MSPDTISLYIAIASLVIFIVGFKMEAEERMRNAEVEIATLKAVLGKLCKPKMED